MEDLLNALDLPLSERSSKMETFEQKSKMINLTLPSTAPDKDLFWNNFKFIEMF